MFTKEFMPNNSSASKEIAKERLKNILMRDRVDVSGEIIDSVRDDIISVATDYFTVSPAATEIYLTNMQRAGSENGEAVLVCLIPISKIRK